MIKEATKKTLVLLVCIIVVIMPFVATAQVGADCVTTDGKAGKIAVGSGAMGGGQTYCQPNTQAGSNNPVVAAVGIGLDKVGGYLLEYTGISNFLMGATSFILIFSGWLLDSVLSFTVTGMSDQIGTGTTIGTSITEAWGIIRDVANMVFIFVLLYTAFRTMFMSEYSNVGRSILNIVLIAILINFSLFFAKVVIDASNIVADGFYRAISQGNSMTLKNSNIGVAEYKGISGGVMKMLGMQTIYGTGVTKDGSLFSTAGASRILLFGTVSGIFMIVASVVFFMASIMFIARFIILIFLMILAPFAFIAFIIPGFSGRFWDWWASLFNQAFFAPVFFALMWVAFKVGSAIVTKPLNSEYGTDWSYIITDPKKAFGAVINYVLVLGLFITALTISKQMASKGSTAAAFGAITGATGTATLGGVALAGRESIGRLANRFASNKDLQLRAEAGDIGARMKLATAQKIAGSTFDVRNVGESKFGKTLGLDKVTTGMGTIYGKGGYTAIAKERAEKDKRKIEAERIIDAQRKIVAGSTTTTGSAFDEMQRALGSISDKELERIVVNNKELLTRESFVNALSARQFESINKSDQLDENKKADFNNTRFKDIYGTISSLAPGAGIPGPILDKIKGLTDVELETINPSMFTDDRFVGALKQNQIDSISKSKKFTASQISSIKSLRISPIINALLRGRTGVAMSIFKNLDIKTQISLMRPVGTPPITVATHFGILPAYKVKTLQKMAVHDDMSDQNRQDLRLALLGGPGGTGAPGVDPDVITWLTTGAGKTEFV